MNTNTLPLEVERMSEAQRSAPSASGGNSQMNAKVVAPPPQDSESK